MDACYAPVTRVFAPYRRLRPCQIPSDILLMRLERAAADLDQLGVAPELFDSVFAAVAVAAEHLDRSIGNFLGGGRGEQLGGIGAEPVAVIGADGRSDL